MDVTDESEMFLQHALDIPWGFRRPSLSSHLHRTPVPDLVPLINPPGAQSRWCSYPTESWIFQKTSAPMKAESI